MFQFTVVCVCVLVASFKRISHQKLCTYNCGISTATWNYGLVADAHINHFTFGRLCDKWKWGELQASLLLFTHPLSFWLMRGKTHRNFIFMFAFNSRNVLNVCDSQSSNTISRMKIHFVGCHFSKPNFMIRMMSDFQIYLTIEMILINFWSSGFEA